MHILFWRRIRCSDLKMGGLCNFFAFQCFEIRTVQLFFCRLCDYICNWRIQTKIWLSPPEKTSDPPPMVAPSDTLLRLTIATCQILNTLFQIFSRTKKKLQFFPVLWPCRPNIIYFAMLWSLNPAREEKCEIFEALWSKFFWIPARSSPGQVSGGARDTDWHRLRRAAHSQLPHYLALLQVEQEKLAMPTFNRNVRPDTVLKESALVL